MFDEEGAGSDLPQGLAPGEVGEQLGLGVGQAEQLPGLVDLGGRLAVDDAGLGVGEESFGQADVMRAGRAG